MRRRPSPATLIACVALFFSLGGAGLAASSGTSSPPLILAGGNPVPIPPHGDAVAVARCPRHTAVMSGGGGVSSPAQASITSDQAIPGQRWQVGGYNSSANSDVYVQAFAYCR